MPTWKTYFKALAMAVIIYPQGISSSTVKKTPGIFVEGEMSGPLPSDGNAVWCPKASWNLVEVNQQEQSPATVFTESAVPSFTSKMHFSIPVSSDLVFFTSRGSYDHDSSITVELSDTSGNDIEIDVVLGYYNNAALERANVCLLERNGGGKGVGFFTPHSHHSLSFRDRIKFTATVRLPNSGSSESPLIINAFETTLGIWTHHVTSLSQQVLFKSLSLRGANAPIIVDSASAVSAKFNTNNAPISGSYNVSKSLVLSTSNAPITASVRLENGDDNNATSLKLETINSYIETPITLFSDKSTYTPSAFSVSATTLNGALDISFPEAPTSPFSSLTFTGHTINAPANIKLHPTYEGSISLSSGVFLSSPPIVQADSNAADPSGQNRERTVKRKQLSKGHLEADVRWGEGKGPGKVVVTTSIADIKVELD